MPRPPSRHPTEVELEILKVLWEEGPSELGTIRSALQLRRPVANTTVATMLTVMMGKGLVSRHRGPKGYRWSPSVSREATSAGMIGTLLDRLFDGSAGRMIAQLLEARPLSERDRDEIRRLLDRSATGAPAHEGGAGSVVGARAMRHVPGGQDAAAIGAPRRAGGVRK
ncbi:BlaI/MecI/CopY family transcriptional regulator [Tautonia sociabilis]|uniref:BlaI/MecI/CopY family transcriptional regulator n=1 Tax=Tautonia sociabilis TaxID=2080755 RepID=UPI0013159864|nr:BlaI/MecI/CopY family transcriptional regulator [Tautonia sociabilis]